MMSQRDIVTWCTRERGVPHAFVNGEMLSACHKVSWATGKVVALSGHCCLVCRACVDPRFAPRGPVGLALREMFPERWADSPGWRWTCRLLDADLGAQWTSLSPQRIAAEKRAVQDVFAELLTCILEDDGAEVRDRFVELVRNYRGEGLLP